MFLVSFVYVVSDLAKYREFHLKLLLTDRVYLALKKIENSEKIPAEQILLCGLIQPSAPNDDKTSSPSDGAKGEVKQRMPSMVGWNCSTLGCQATEAFSQLSNALQVKLDDPNKSLIDYGLEVNQIIAIVASESLSHGVVVFAGELCAVLYIALPG